MRSARLRHARRLPAAVLIVAAAWTAAIAAAPQQSRQRSVSVTILDGDDRPVSDLQPRDVIVREDGVAREIVSVAPAPPPTEIVLLVDDSQAAMQALRDLRDGLQGFADLVTSLEPAPAVRLATFGDRHTVLVNFNPAFPAVSRGIEQVAPRPGSGARLLEAIDESTAALRARKAERPVIAAFVVEAGPEFSDVRHTQIREALERANASLWAIVLTQPGGGGSSQAQRERDIVIGDVTRQSGGRSELVLAAQQLPQAFDELAAQLASRWEITYGRPDSLIPPSELEITGRNGELQVLAPEWAAP